MAERIIKAAAEEAERNRLATIERIRVESKKHRSKIDAAIEASLRAITENNEMAHQITKALVQGKIPNVTINY